MIIVYVIDSYGEFSNGTTITAKRSKEYLEKLGHTVRIVSNTNVQDENYFHLKERDIPVVSHFAKKQNMHFSKPNKEVLQKAFEGADLVHLFLPFKTSKKALKIAKKMNIPVTAAYHMQPEHITYGMGLDRYGKPLAWIIYKWLKVFFYKNISHIHCPSNFIKDKLVKNKYSNVFHVISNGVEDKFYIDPKRELNPEVFNILSIGRYSKEKRQDTLLKAIKYSKYKDKIRVTLAGKGPKEKKLRNLVKKYDINVEFAFLTEQELIKTIANSDLYVHPAEAEIEGMSALEAISSGLVPIVAKSNNSATSQFTLSDKSVFKVRKHKELAKKIDYFIENAQERIDLGEEYKISMKRYNIHNSINLMEEFFKEAITDFKRNETSNKKEGKKLHKKFRLSWIGKFLSFLFYFGIAMTIFVPYFLIVRGVRIKGKRKLRKHKNGAIIITNHVHKLDAILTGMVAFPKKPIYTSIPENLNNPYYGFLVKLLGAIPIATTLTETKIFLLELKSRLVKGKYVHFFPEGEINEYSNDVKEFKKGAFVLAEEAKVPVIPVRINFVPKKSRWSYPFFFKDRITITVGEPIYPNIHLSKRESITDLLNRATESMENIKI